MSGERVMTVRQAAAYLCVGEETIRRWIRQRKLPAIALGGERTGYRVLQSDIDRLLAEHRTTGASELEA